MHGKSNYEIETVEDLLVDPARGRRQLGPTEVVIALARSEQATDPERRLMLMSLLSDEEKERMARFRFERDRLLFLTLHGLARITLSRHENVQPQDWRFVAPDHGRPEIAEPSSRLRFSLSRRQGLAACAVMLDRNIGVDVEYVSQNYMADIAERFFSPQEQSDLLRAPINVRAELFVEYWTLKEAYLKAIGLGLSFPPHEFTLRKGLDGTWRLASGHLPYQDSERWRFRSWRVADDYRIALAIDQTGLDRPGDAIDWL